MKHIILSSVLTVISLFATAQSRSSYDASFFKSDDDNQEAPIEVGKGFIITDPYKNTRPCFTSESRDESLLKKQGTTGVTTKVEVFYTKNQYEYNLFKNTNLSGSIDFINMISSSGEYLKNNISKTQRQVERLIFVGTVDFGNYFYPNEPVFTADAKSLLEEGKFDLFKSLYGTHFVSGIGKASTITVELLREIDENDIYSLDKFGVNPQIKYKANLNFKLVNTKEVNDKFKNNNYQVIVTVMGPHLDTNAWEETVKKLNSNENVVSAVSSFIKGQLKDCQNENDALISRYFIRDFTMYGCEGIKWNLEKEKKLSSINKILLETYMIIDMAQKCIDKNPIDDKDTYFYHLVNYYSFPQNSLKSKVDGLKDEWQKLINDAKIILPKIKKQYKDCSDITCDINGDCCSNIDYTQNVKDLFIQYNKIIEKIVSYITDWYKEIKFGSVIISNKSSNPYTIFINGKPIRTLQGNQTYTYKSELGTYQFKAVQQSGYIFYATVNETNVVLSKEGEKLYIEVGE